MDGWMDGHKVSVCVCVYFFLFWPAPQPEERYYSLCWSHDPDAGGNVVCVVGEHGIIKVISVAKMSLHKVRSGW